MIDPLEELVPRAERARAELNQLLEQLEAEREAVKAATIEAHEAVQGLRSAVREAKEEMRQASKAEARKHLARQMRAEDKQGSRAEAPPLADQAAGWMTARYLLAVRKLAEQRMAGVLDLQTMRDFLHDVVAVRRGDHRAARLQLERERRDSSGEQGAGSQEQGERRDSSGVL